MKKSDRIYQDVR